MSRSLKRDILAALSASLCLCAVAQQALAVERHRSIEVEPGTPVRVANHIHFRASTCQTISIPKIVIRKQPAKGKVVVMEEIVPLRRARTERGEDCIGTPMRAATIRYTASKQAKGNDVLAYDVIFPASCVNCRNLKVTVGIAIEEDFLEPGRPAAREPATARAPAKVAPRPDVIVRVPEEASRSRVTLPAPAEMERSAEPSFSESEPEGPTS